MSTSETDTEEGVFDRNFRLCPMLSCIATEELIRTCDECKCFFVYCCHCNNAYGNDGRYDTGKICHHFRLVFTDGACRMNGQAGATAGVGIACSEEENHQLSIPITDEMDPGQRRTSQRAELWAALTGLRYLVMSYGVEKNGAKKKNRQDSQGEAAWVIATDSEYVVKGMTEWLPAWKENDHRNSRNTTPANLDLFMKLDAEVSAQERKNVKIGFWHVLRKFNTIADGLAKRAAVDGDPAP